MPELIEKFKEILGMISGYRKKYEEQQVELDKAQAERDQAQAELLMRTQELDTIATAMKEALETWYALR